ncbi:MAG: hypothetical protein ABI700_27025 [Chloroflexota bacterium]
MTEFYQIVIKEEVDDQWADWFVGLSITHNERGETILSASVTDQAELHGVLMRIRDLGLTLLLVNRLGTKGETDA